MKLSLVSLLTIVLGTAKAMQYVPEHYCHNYYEYAGWGGDGDCTDGNRFEDVWAKCMQDGPDICMGVMWYSCNLEDISDTTVPGAWKLVEAHNNFIGDGETCEHVPGHWGIYLAEPQDYNDAQSVDECDPDNNVMIFTGYDRVESVEKGTIDVAWKPAFVYFIGEEGPQDDKFLDCGDYTYTVIVAKGNVTFSHEMSHADIKNMAESSPTMQVIETQDRVLSLSNMPLGEEYSVLVLARTDAGSESLNRAHALINVSSESPKVKEGFTRMLNFPVPPKNGDWGVEFYQMAEGEEHFQLNVWGNYPEGFSAITGGDFITIHGRILNVEGKDAYHKMMQVTKVWTDAPSGIVLDGTAKQLSDIFDELDASYEINQEQDDDEFDDELIDLPYSDEELAAELMALPDKVKIDICIAAKGVEDMSCFDVDGQGRMLGTEHNRELFFSFIANAVKKVFKEVKKAAVKVAETARKVVKVVETTAKEVAKAISEISATLDATVTFLDVDKTAKLTCEVNKEKEFNNGASVSFEGKIEIGVQFDMSAKARFKVKVSADIKNPLDNAVFSLYGGLGARAYMELGAALNAAYKPDPFTIFKKSKTQTFWAGPIPIVITNEPQLQAVVDASLSIEAEALVQAQFGWDYNLTFAYNKFAAPGEKFITEAIFEKRPVLPEDPEFSLRLKADLQLGLLFSWDLILYGILQGTIAADLALNAGLEVGTDLEMIAVTGPGNTPASPVVALDRFDLSIGLVVRARIGLHNPIELIIPQIEEADDEDSKMCTFSIEGTGFEKPSVETDKSIDTGSDVLDSIVDKTTECLKSPSAACFGAAAFSFLQEQLADDEVFKAIGDTVDVISRFIDNLGFEFVVFEIEIDLLEIPEVEIEMESAQTCQGSSAILLEFSTKSEQGALLGGNWYGNFDGTILTEETDWVILDNDNVHSVTLSLPRSSLEDYQIEEGASLFLRATPAKLPFFQNAMLEKVEIDHEAIESFECCDSSDCVNKYGQGSVCQADRTCIGGERPEETQWEDWMCDYFPSEWHELDGVFSSHDDAIDKCEMHCPLDVHCQESLWEDWMCDYFPNEWHQLDDVFEDHEDAIMYCEVHCPLDVHCEQPEEQRAADVYGECSAWAANGNCHDEWSEWMWLNCDTSCFDYETTLCDRLDEGDYSAFFATWAQAAAFCSDNCDNDCQRHYVTY